MTCPSANVTGGQPDDVSKIDDLPVTLADQHAVFDEF